MSRRQKEPLRVVSRDEWRVLERVACAHSEPASHVARARALLAVAAGQSYTAAAGVAGRRSGDAVAQLVARFNAQGCAAVAPGHGGGPQPVYGADEQERILAEVRRMPDRETDQTATWSLSLLQQALRRAPDGLPQVSTYTIWRVLRGAGWSWQRSRSWCDTGVALRTRKAGVVRVTDPDSTPKKR